MLSTLRWAGKAANANSLADPNATFDPTLPCASGEEAAVDALVKADAPKRLLERLQKKPQEIGPDCLYENAESILRFFEEDTVLGKDPFGDINSVEDAAALEPEQLSLLRSLQERNHICARVHCERILSKELKANVSELEARVAKERAPLFHLFETAHRPSCP